MLTRTEINGAIATVTLARPEVHNAFNAEMIMELGRTFIELGHDNDVRVIILAGEGPSFCAGADVRWMRSMVDASYDDNIKDAEELGHMLEAIAHCEKPVIGRIHGHAFGGGVGLISVCDIAIATRQATFCLSEVRLGLLPAVISPFVLRKLPASRAQRYFLTGERFSATDAERFGLVSQVVNDEASLDIAISYVVDALMNSGPEAVSICKKMIPDILAMPNEKEALVLAVSLIADRRVSQEGQEGMRAFLVKRPPNWAPQPAPSAAGNA